MKIRQIDIIHHMHTDFGFTDHATVCRQLHRQCIDQALDAILATRDQPADRKFYWTAEVLEPVWQWWRQAGPRRRGLLLSAVESGQMEVTGFPFHNTPFLSEEQWEMMFRWIPDELWKLLKIRTGMQNDVNGLPLAGAMQAKRRGIRYIWMGPNSYIGGPPFPAPTAFRWLLPDGASLFVWLNSGYCNGYFLFEQNWRLGPVPPAADLCYRPPRPGELFATDEPSMRVAHRRCQERIAQLEAVPVSAASGRLLVSITNQWRMDNDPPFPALTEFVARWNEMGLEPRLRLTIPSTALEELERELGGAVPTYQGEWVDWWANGTASAPADLAASRKAKRILKYLRSPIVNKITGRQQQELESVTRELCLFDEHTWGSWQSVASPYSWDTLGQKYEKGALAYRSLARAEYLLAEAVRRRWKRSPAGLYVSNPTPLPVSDWVEIPSDCLRNRYTHVLDEKTGEIREILYRHGPEPFVQPTRPRQFSFRNTSRTFIDNAPGRTACIWTGTIDPGGTRRYTFTSQPARFAVDGLDSTRLGVAVDRFGWPLRIRWPKMAVSLFEAGFGDFLSIEPAGFAPRWKMRNVFMDGDDRRRKVQWRRNMTVRGGTYSTPCRRIETPYTIVFEQRFRHPLLAWGWRVLQIWKEEPKARLNVSINRRPSMNPQVLYLQFPLPCHGVVPYISTGGHAFQPGDGQLAGSCMDHYAIDGWVGYPTSSGSWIWSSSDAALIAFEKPNAAARLISLPRKTEFLLSLLFDNTWDTNFVADAHGVMEFEYDLIWRRDRLYESELKELGESLAHRPLVLVKV